MKPSYVKLSYDHYTFSLRERIQYSVFSLILCFLVNDLCYRNVISFFFFCPFVFCIFLLRKNSFFMRSENGFIISFGMH